MKITCKYHLQISVWTKNLGNLCLRKDPGFHVVHTKKGRDAILLSF